MWPGTSRLSSKLLCWMVRIGGGGVRSVLTWLSGWRLNFVLVSSYVAFVLLTVPLADAFQLGGDEHYECTKALLTSKGLLLYTQVWSDQPPLFTSLLAAACGAFECSLLVCRTVVLCFTMVLLTGFASLVAAAAGRAGVVCAFIVLCCAPMFHVLSVSVMQEVPAFSMAVVALWAGHKWAASDRPVWAFASGAALGLAAGLKLTSLMVAPALCVLVLSGKACKERCRLWLAGCSFAAGCAAVGLWIHGQYPQLDFATLLTQHLSPHVRQRALNGDGMTFSIRLFSTHLDAMLPAVVACVLHVLNRDVRPILVPATWLLSALIVHELNVPYWDFYYLHFAIPLAWLSGCGFAAVFRQTREHAASLESPQLYQWAAWGGMGALLLAYMLVQGGVRVQASARRMDARVRVGDLALVRELATYAPKARWIYTRATMYAFVTGLKVPPELAVVSFKRIASGSLDDDRILRIIRMYKPDLILVPSYEPSGDEWNELLSKYEASFAEDNLLLYVRKGFAKGPASPTRRAATFNQR